MTRWKVCLAVLLLGSTTASADIRQLSLPANDLVYDPGTHRIYATVPSSAGAIGNSVTAIDPETGQIGPSVFIGSEPGRLALSDDGMYLDVGPVTAVLRLLPLPAPPSAPNPMTAAPVAGRS